MSWTVNYRNDNQDTPPGCETICTELGFDELGAHRRRLELINRYRFTPDEVWVKEEEGK